MYIFNTEKKTVQNDKRNKKTLDVRIISLANYLGVSFETMQSISVHRRAIVLKDEQVLTLYKALSLKTPLEELPGAGDFLWQKKQQLKTFNKLLATKRETYIHEKHLYIH